MAVPLSCYEVIDPYEQRNTKNLRGEDKNGKGKKKPQKGPVKKQQSEVVATNSKNKFSGANQVTMFGDGTNNHLYRHSMSSENMQGAIVGSKN